MTGGVPRARRWTLTQGLGAAFTPEVREAWTLTYGALAGIMIGAQRVVSRAAA